MRRSVLVRWLWLLALIVAGGCRPDPPDQLAWQISAETPNDYYQWCEVHEARMSPAVHTDFVVALRSLAAVSRRFGGALDLRETNNPFCQRINALTVREVILDGLTAYRDQVAARLSRVQAAQLRNIEHEPAGGDPALMAAYAQARTDSEQTVARLRAHIAKVEERLHCYENGGDPESSPSPFDASESDQSTSAAAETADNASAAGSPSAHD